MKWAHAIATLFLIAASLLFAPTAFSSDEIRIVDVGIQGYYSAADPTIVQILVIHADSRPATIELRLHVQATMEIKAERIDTFVQTVKLGANEQRVVDVPVVLFLGGNTNKLEVEEADDRGQVIGKDSVPLNGNNPENLIAIICAEQSVCQEAQSQIAFSGAPPEQAAKGKQVKFVNVRYPPTEWLGYATARTVVLAGPTAQMSQGQRDALEGFVRRGGTLIIVQDRAADSTFLAPYRIADSSTSPNVVGSGKIFWIPSLQSKQLAELYTGPGLPRAVYGW